ncbi:MAG TPA: efflux RND transporter periplasmic adaptor subunit, partial [Candidatus Saccharimonadales bacterium]|nr:efflux RND transporter periplasmic adaptor subunit [Candidatus Saccharimonadales bacterium]
MNFAKKGEPPLRQWGTLFLAIMASVILVTLAGCGQKPAGPGAYNMPPPDVGVVMVKSQSLPLTTELPGRIDPVQIAQVRARVDGIVLHQEFVQGSDVKAGQVLYQIDPAPYQATLDSARASLMQAQQLVQRYKPLVSINAVSKLNYDNAVAAAAQAKAAQEIAAINLGYCTVTAPISGRIGPALVTEGALVSQTAATEMAVIQQMDPIYFDFTESSTEFLKLRQEMEAGQLKSLEPGTAKVTLILPDGTTYPHPGKLLFSDVTVDPTSGMITLRSEFPNPNELLLPGMFAVGRLEQAVEPQAMLIPQPAVTISPDGTASVMLVTATNSVMPQPIQIGSAVGSDWIVKSGLKEGDQVIVDGLQKVQPGMEVKPVPASVIEENPF